MMAWNHPDDSIYGVTARSRKIVDTMEDLLGGEVYHYHSKIPAKNHMRRSGMASRLWILV